MANGTIMKTEVSLMIWFEELENRKGHNITKYLISHRNV